jgi:hypothetical protein
LKNHSAFIFAFKGLHDPNDKDIVILRNIGNYSSIDKASLARSLESSAGALVRTSELALLQSILKCRVFHKGVINKENLL